MKCLNVSKEPKKSIPNILIILVNNNIYILEANTKNKYLSKLDSHTLDILEKFSESSE